MKEANKQIYDKEDRAEQQAKSIQCGPQLGQLTDLPYEPQTYLDHTPSTHKKPTGGNWQVYSQIRERQRHDSAIQITGSLQFPLFRLAQHPKAVLPINC